jgi:hypothetical protein
MYFKDFIPINDFSLLCAILNFDWAIKEKYFIVSKLNDRSSLPCVDVVDAYGNLHTHAKVLKQIVKEAQIITPYGNINTSNGILYNYNNATIPIIKEMLCEKDNEYKISTDSEIVAMILTMNQAASVESSGSYLDYHYTHLNIQELQSHQNTKKLENITFMGFNQQGIMQFSFLSKRGIKNFFISEFLPTTTRYLYFPKLEFDESITLDEIENILNTLFDNKYLDFGDDVGKIQFEFGIVANIMGITLAIIPSTRNHLEELMAIIKKSKVKTKNRFQGLKIKKIQKDAKSR